ncbi:zinc finger protein ZAT4-like [Mangifera indica]|uniref:zinc finger protein ZAT4-like n=1 Tax=Mangifera indica TaxID=29780 RepID=UPI001CFB8527|nr:zinc finger protein ZAT4-like [Mangifera indica]
MDSAHEEVEHKKSKVGSEDNGHIGYGLRENPKKSWRFSGFKEVNTSTSAAAASASSMEENQCKVCGKEFVSMKALYGHMRHHSGSKRGRIQCKECEKSFLSLKSLTNHMRVHSQKLRLHNVQSETNSSSSRQDLVVEGLYAKKKRSKRIRRYNSSNSSSISSLNESLPSFTEIDDQEVEQVAVCLMMLSRGVHDWGKLHSFNGFSDDDDDACASDSLTVLYEQIEKNDEFEVCVEKSNKGSSEFEMPKLDNESEFVSYDTEIEKEIVLKLKFESNSPSKKVKFDACDSETGVDSEMVDDSGEKCSTKCKICNKFFHSGQALGGHQKKHGIKKGCKAQKTDSWEDQNQTGAWPKTEPDCKLVKLECIKNLTEGSKASGAAVIKEHKCPICFKVFISGQALGGHKRAHFLKNPETRPQEIPMSQGQCSISGEMDIDIPMQWRCWLQAMVD